MMHLTNTPKGATLYASVGKESRYNDTYLHLWTYWKAKAKNYAVTQNIIF